jgi:hypothetical protein
LLEARDERRLLRLQRQLAAYRLLIIDELGYVPLSQTGTELLLTLGPRIARPSFLSAPGEAQRGKDGCKEIWICGKGSIFRRG